MLSDYIVLTRTQLWVSCIAGLVFAVPLTSLIAMMVVFPILFFGAIAIVANVWPIGIAIGYALFGFSPWVERTTQAWQMSTIMWFGSAFGISNWGSVGSTIGAKNMPFLEVLFMPWIALVRYVLG